MNTKSIIASIIALVWWIQGVTAQTLNGVTGPSCIQPSTTQNYAMQGPTTGYSYSVTGGTLSTGGTTGTSTGSIKNITVNWGATGGSISMSSPSFSTTYTVSVPSTFDGGTVSSGGTQALVTGSTPADIVCPKPTGGYCPPTKPSQATYSYQWQQSANNSSFSNISGATSINLSFSSGLTQTMYYKRMATSDQSGFSASSTTATITIYQPVNAGGVNPPSQTINYNSTPSTLSLSGTSGGNGTYTYQWYSSPDSANWTLIPSGTTASYTPGALTATTYYRVAVSSVGLTGYAGYKIVVLPPVVAGTPVNATQQINYNTMAAALSLSGTSGGNGTYAYQWLSCATINGFYTATGATGASYTPGPLTGTTYFQVVVTSNGASVNSAFFTVNVYPKVNSGSISPSSQWIAYNTQPGASLTVAAATGGNGTYSYQWLASTTLSGPYTSLGVTATSYLPSPSLTNSKWYKVVATSNGANDTSGAAVVNVHVIAGSIAGPGSPIKYNTGASINNLSLPAGGGCGGSYAYRWFQSSDGAAYTLIDGASGSSYTSVNLMADTWFVREASCSLDTALSTPFKVSVAAPLQSGVVSPGNLTVISGSTPGQLSASAAIGGLCSGSYGYLWQQSTDGISFSSASGTNANQTYVPGALTTTTWYRVRVTCGTDTAFSDNVVVTISSSSLIADANYVRTKVISKSGVKDPVVADSLSDIYDVKVSTQFIDGQYRSIQTVESKKSPAGKDFVTGQAYDIFSRPTLTYLPFTDTSNPGGFKSNFQQTQVAFNANQFPGENFYYSLKALEPSLLSRPVGDFPAGASWTGTSKGITYDYLVNTAADSVHIWNISLASGSIPTDIGRYMPGSLTKKIATDEQGHKLVEYTDMDGHILLKKAQFSDTPGGGHSGWLCTYYVYDNAGSLRTVIQPKGVEWLSNNGWNFLTTGGLTVLSELCFVYNYDGRNRVISKQVPGGGRTLMVYDFRDRLVMSQDSALKATGRWWVTEYDSLNRAVRTGLLTDTHDQAYHQNLAYNSIIYPNTSTGYEVLTQTYYDDYTWINGSTGGIGSSMASITASDLVSSVNTYPQYAQPLTSYTNARGKQTGSMVKVLDSTINLYSANFFDDYGRVIQTQTSNFTGAVDTVTTQYDFGGKTLRTILYHRKNNNTAQTHSVVTKVSYDGAGRQKSISKNIDHAGADQLIDSMLYNEIGQVRAKYLGNNIDSVVQDYNIRGWIAGINKKFVAGSSTNWFGEEIAYDKSASVTGASYSPLYNGNIAGVTWKGAGDSTKRKYDFSYDNVNRLTAALFQQNMGSGWTNATVNYSVQGLQYDASGNIRQMNQRGLKFTSSPTIDSLNYSYQTTSNKLQQISDAVNDSLSVLGDFHYKGTKGSLDYVYDKNGNLSRDNNKGIDTIIYNHLNLPKRIHFVGKGDVIFTYDAAGMKLRKLVLDSAGKHATTTIYLHDIVYQHTDTITNPSGSVDTLQYITHDEGVIRWAYRTYLGGTKGYQWEYDFYEKDHMGNTRAILTQQKDTTQYLATMEGYLRAKENALFYNIPQTSYSRVTAGYPNDTSTTPTNDSVAMLNGNAGRIQGPALILKVMKGDVFDVAVRSFYNNNSATNTTPSITDVLSSLANGIVGITGGSKGSYSQLNNPASPLFGALSLFNQKNDTLLSNAKPKAYLNWLFLDNQFNYDSVTSGARSVGDFAAGTLGTLGQTGIIANKSGFLYVYVSNETVNWPVYFDNLSIVMKSSPLVEESHYYPFGLTMAGISDKALKSGYKENKYRFNKGSEIQNKEFSDGSGLELYGTQYRLYDPQIGRFNVLDPKPVDSVGLYTAFYNNPLRFNDPLGDTTRVYVETKKEGHAWISTGEGDKMVVYTYGRYNGVNEGSGPALTRNGPGVLVRLEGKEAQAFNDKKFNETGGTVFQIRDVKDETINKILDAKFNSHSEIPATGQFKFKSTAHVIDEYKLLSHNCATFVSDALNEAGSEALKKMDLHAGYVTVTHEIPLGLYMALLAQTGIWSGLTGVAVEAEHKPQKANSQ